jgi:hypothetical protein
MAAIIGKLKIIETVEGKYRPRTLVSLLRGKALKLTGRIRRGRA